jgi:tetratricopeptide (TPR) repeat protein
MLYQAMGDHVAALPLARQALEVRRAALGEAHPSFATSLDHMAQIYMEMSDYAAALPLSRQSLEVRRAALGEAHPSFAISLSNLAHVYRVMGDHAAALPLCRQALEVTRAALGEAHPVFATCLNNLAQMYQDMGDHAAALPLARQSLEVTRAALGETHPDFARGLNNLADLSVALGRPFEALLLFQQAIAVENRQIAQILSIGSERQRAVFLHTVYFGQMVFLSIVTQHFTGAPDAIGAAVNLVLQRKAIVAETLSAQRDAILGGRYPTLQNRLCELTALRQQIARKTLGGPGPEGPFAHQERINQWIEEKERLEADLARQVPEMNLEKQLQAGDHRAVALALPPHTSLLEFVRFHVFDFNAVPARGEQSWQTPRYLVFVISGGNPDAARMIDLGEAEPIDRLIAEFRASVTGEAELRDLAKAPDSPTAKPVVNAGQRLRAALLDPLTESLSGCNRLLLAPDGHLNRLPFEVLPTTDGHHLLDFYRISYVSVGRDVLRFQVYTGCQPREPLVVADPDFDVSMGMESLLPKQPDEERDPWEAACDRVLGQRKAEAAIRPIALTPSPVSRLSRDLDRSRYHFPRLPGTRAEGEQIARRLAVQPLIAGAVLEGRLKVCRSPRILHLATHGFFLADQERNLNKLGRNLELIGVGDNPGWGPFGGPGMENPMLRSGLALAGANSFLRGATLPPEAEDGLMTAEDVTGLDLLDTELVVLSACDTGLGDIHAGEGVFGLRRAFIVAGAKTLVMSLWKVPDLATSFLMDRFYDNLLTRRMDRDLALTEAQRFTRDASVGQLKQEWLSPAMIERLAGGDAEARRRLEALAARSDDHRPFESPFYWGAFICQGDPSPLPTLPEQ